MGKAEASSEFGPTKGAVDENFECDLGSELVFGLPRHAIPFS